MKANKNSNQGESMNNDDRRLWAETLAEMKELKGAMREFKEHILVRVDNLEKKENERSKQKISIVAVLISGAALAISIVVNFFKGGK